MYLWGLYAAVLLYASSVVLSEILQRKPLWKLLFNTGQYMCSLAAAWMVMVIAGVTPSPTAPLLDMSASDLWWIAVSWVVYHLVNLALVAGLAADEGVSWWDDFSDEFWFYTVSTLAVLALSPLIAIVAVAYPYSWTMLPLLLLPLLAVQKTAEMSRHQEHQSLHDPLTGLPNRVLLNDRIEQALARSSRMRGMVVVMFLDLDLFKVVNDSLGHHAGDELLINVAQRLKAAVRSGDTLARFGGDEFVVMCEDVSEEEVTAIAGRITASLRQSFVSDDREVTVTASVGVAVAKPSSTPQTLLRDADVAMYRAKEHGRNQVVRFDEAMHRQANERLLDAVGLRRALEHDEFRVVYQPVLDIATGRTIGMEALVRWEDPDRGLVAPGLFIPAASGSLSPASSLVVSLLQDTKADQSEGRLGMELMRIRELFQHLPPGAMVILDELCSGTNPSEGEEIFELVVKMLGRLEPQVCITTHFLSFADRLRREAQIPGLTFLQVELGADQAPTYQFVPGVARTSLAGQTAARLGVTAAQLNELVDANLQRAVN